MEEESSATYRYYCHMCSRIVRPELGIEEVKCPHCHSGFVEEMADDFHADGRPSNNAAEADSDSSDARSERAASPWAPILMDLLNGSSGPDGGGDLAALARRQYRHLAFLQLFHALQEGGADENAPDSGLDRLVLVSPSNAHGGNRDGAAVSSGLTLGELILGPGLDLLLEYLAETDPSRQGTPPAKKEAVAAMPTVQIREAATTCPVCLDEFVPGGEAKEMPCKHRFHDECIVPWLEVHSSCPVCRYQLPTDEPAEPAVNVNGPESIDGDSSTGNPRGIGGGSNGRRWWLAWPFGRLFSRRSNGSSSSS